MKVYSKLYKMHKQSMYAVIYGNYMYRHIYWLLELELSTFNYDNLKFVSFVNPLTDK
jgi:hypothetical protein